MTHYTTSFDRYGKCPICKKPFKSKACPHDYWYVMDVLQAAAAKSGQFAKDVERVSKRKTSN